MGQELFSILNHCVVETLSGPPHVVNGPEFSGISPVKWVYADLVVRLDDGRCVALSPGRCDVIAGPISGTTTETFYDEDGHEPIGRTILELIAAADGEPDVAIVLSGGFLLSHYYVPGGSQYGFERIASSLEKRGEWISLLGGRAVDLLTFRSQADAR